ncbi:CFTR inhibitory factor Cif [Rugosimonospora acidiphila]|uniref:CFTR inhibitory factor Cif n=2 Tax=Rugosimonospora acidiphila TaxID=556531 RepID=A0ABP9SRQ7_9ACTN
MGNAPSGGDAMGSGTAPGEAGGGGTGGGGTGAGGGEFRLIEEIVSPVAERRPPDGFSELATSVDGVMINYVRGGDGPTLVLLHGYPQTWYMWRKVMPEFGQHYTVVAPDLRGAGDSAAPAGGYDKKTLAGDVHGLLAQLGLDESVRIIGHDIGMMVAYSYAAQHPDSVQRLVLCESLIPDESVYHLPALTQHGPGIWNFGLFNVDSGFPERLVAGRELAWVRGFMGAQAVHPEGIDDQSLREYARCLLDEEHLSASFAYFRTLDQDVADNAEYAQSPLPMPVLAIGAAGSLGDSVSAQVARYAQDVSSGVVDGSGHWLFEEQPDKLSQQLLGFLE